MTHSLIKEFRVGGDSNPRTIAWQQTQPLSSTGKPLPGGEEQGSQNKKPGLFWLNGFRSDMTGEKSVAVTKWASRKGLQTTRFDYSGHGLSSGDFIDGTIGQWREEAFQLFERCTTGPQILVGSSMGGWIALLLLQSHLKSLSPDEKSRIAGIILIAPAFNMTRDLIWMNMDDDIRKIVHEEGHWMRPSSYGDGSYPITRELIKDGEYHLINAVFPPRCPVRILQGMADEIVPWRHSMKLVRHLDEDNMSFNLIKDAGHRLGRPEDIKRLIQLIEELV